MYQERWAPCTTLHPWPLKWRRSSVKVKSHGLNTLQFMPNCRQKVNFYFSPNSAYFTVKHRKMNLLWKTLLSPVRAQSGYLLGYGFLYFMVLPWCCHQGLFKDSIIHSWYIFSVVLLPLPPPLNASCCRVALLFSPFCAQWSSFLTDTEKSDWL